MSSTEPRVVRFQTLDQLAALAGHWDRLARGVPFRSWTWASAWWRHYGVVAGDARRLSLFVLAVLDASGRPVGIAPWYMEKHVGKGSVLRFLGDGEVCSDYLSVLSEWGWEDRVAAALADWLTRAHAPADRPAGCRFGRWDLLELAGVDADDVATRLLAVHLEARGNTVHRRRGPACWRIELPDCWETYLSRLSRPCRRKVRQATQRILTTDRAVLHSVGRLDEIPDAWDVLVDLHQRRWRAVGEPGCFASGRFAAFHRDVLPDLLRNGQLLLDWLELDGRPVAAEYHLAGNDVMYAYQCGMSPDALKDSPGHLGTIIMLRKAVEQGFRAYDFLRGDEPYKRHWQAQPRSSLLLRVVPGRAASLLRHRIWLAAAGLKRWIKNRLEDVVGTGEPARKRNQTSSPA
ncbi:MAG: GNAT family N-acetyltransferase [Planctomycetota bacterium]|jgi:CelD/BcsL family acetyltransferase involved in cellulose biosynthesis